jgi:hypothetical protein
MQLHPRIALAIGSLLPLAARHLLRGGQSADNHRPGFQLPILTFRGVQRFE